MRRRLFQLPRTRERIARDVDTELAFHLEMRIAELVRLGHTPADAERRARDEFGDLEFTRNYCQSMDQGTETRMRLSERIADWRQDVRYAARTLRRRPGFAFISLLTLALAIGANSAVFSVARAVLLAPLPYASPSELMRLYGSDVKDPTSRWPFSPADYLDFVTQQKSFAALGGMETTTATWVPEKGEPEILSPLYVTPNLFPNVLRVPAQYGRSFTADEGETGKDQKVILAQRFWRRAFGGDRGAVGRRMRLGGENYEIVGIMPSSFSMGLNEDLYFPLGLGDAMADAVRARKQHYVHVFGRLKSGVLPAAALAELVTIAKRLEGEYPASNTDRTVSMMPLHDWMVGDAKQGIVLLQAAALLVLLIACANLSNLTLSRAIGREREMAVRAALGAGRGRLVRQLLTESVMLSVVGGVIGIAVAAVATRALLAINPRALPAMFTVSTDSRVVGFSILASIVTGVLFGLIPALSVARADLHSSLKDAGRGSSSGRGSERVRQVLVVAQIGLAVMLLIGSGLLIRSFAKLTSASTGFDVEHVLTAQLRAGGSRYDSASAVNRFYDEVLRSVGASPGVVAVGAVTMLPTQGDVGTSLRVEGRQVDEGHLPDLGYLAVRGDYFKAVRGRLIAGRLFETSDRADGPAVALLNETAAKRNFPEGNAIGARVRIGPDPNGNPITIIGVVADMRDQGLGAPVRPTIIMNHVQQAWDRSMSIAVRTIGDPNAAAAALRRAVKEADPLLAIRQVRTLDDVVSSSLAPRRFSLGLVSTFAAIALALAAIGIYGVLSYAVTARTREFGVRIALGASARSVLMLVARQGLAWSLTGLAFGIGGAIAAGRLIAGMLYGVGALDVWTYVGVAGGLLVVVSVACLVPATRATRVDPITAMRAE
jgi:putative ABC transport system permease protein